MKAIGVILAGGNHGHLHELTELRATSAMPVGGCYRALDFSLSSMSNSGINKVAVFTQYNSRSLLDHLSSAKWWDLGRKQGGLFIFSPYLTSKNSFWFRGTADSIFQNITYLKRSNEPYVVIASGNSIYKMDFNEVIHYHYRKDADVTIVYRQAPDGEDLRKYGVMEFDAFERVTDLEEKPLEPQSDLISMGIYVISRTLLIKLLETIQSEERYDLVKDIFIRYRKKLRIYGYRFNGYWRAINSVKSYFDCNMDFLRKEVRDLFTKNEPFIETKPKDEPPGKYNMGAQAKDALVGSGSIINGYIEHSVLFRKVFTSENSVIRNSVVMEGSYIGNGCVVENAILDKEVVLSDGKQICGAPDNPIIIAKSAVL
ncbi:MAG: glucose-1-phosphate adenylyltransferase subunit GlgD [Clostridiales bacterium]|jgi:glucose-1-phosphate adenylyltransferase|nr:glucose-1-phosphate adenylyltransferase subunit GlgD [Clostridiales bacterium]